MHYFQHIGLQKQTPSKQLLTFGLELLQECQWVMICMYNYVTRATCQVYLNMLNSWHKSQSVVKLAAKVCMQLGWNLDAFRMQGMNFGCKMAARMQSVSILWMQWLQRMQFGYTGWKMHAIWMQQTSLRLWACRVDADNYLHPSLGMKCSLETL